MKIQALLFLSVFLFSCGNKIEKNEFEIAIERVVKRLNANNFIVGENDEKVKGQTQTKRIFSVEIYGCKGIDLMDRSLKPEMKSFASEIKNTYSGIETIEKIKIKLVKDPNDKTPSKSGLYIQEKGFTFDLEEL